jgi:hypothetical protein
MASDGVIEGVNVSGDGVFGLPSRLPSERPDQLMVLKNVSTAALS